MAKLTFGRLTDAWMGEASDFTPLLADQLDTLGDAIGIDLVTVGKSEVLTTGGRRIDIVARGVDGSELVVENQYGRADHDHLTRGLAYAVAREARGLVVVAEEHRDEFKALANYLNELAERAPERGISVWLVEARAVRIGGSPWAPLFTAVVEPNAFSKTVEQAKASERAGSIDDFLVQVATDDVREAAGAVFDAWRSAGFKRRIEPTHVVLEAPGPSASGIRTVVAVYDDGRIFVPFSSYAGQNSGIPIPDLVTDEFRAKANALFGFTGSEKHARTATGWLSGERADALSAFCFTIATAYAAELSATPDIT